MEAGFLLVFDKTMLILNFILLAHAEINSMKWNEFWNKIHGIYKNINQNCFLFSLFFFSVFMNHLIIPCEFFDFILITLFSENIANSWNSCRILFWKKLVIHIPASKEALYVFLFCFALFCFVFWHLPCDKYGSTFFIINSAWS